MQVYRDRWRVPTDDPDVVVPLAPFTRIALLEEGVLPDEDVDFAVSSSKLSDIELVRVLRGVIRSWAEPKDLRFLEADDAAAGSCF